MRTLTINLLFLFAAHFFIVAQDTTLLDFTYYQTSDKSEAEFMKISFMHPENKKFKIEEVYYISGELQSRTWLRNIDNVYMPLFKREFYKNQQLKSDLKYNKKGLNGNIKTFWENGTLRRDDVFKNNELVEGKCFDSEGNPIEYVPYKIKASFKGGSDSLYYYINKNLSYPEESLENFEEGLVTVVFLVDTLGNILETDFVSSGHKLLDDEALRIIKSMPRWQPAVNEGKKVFTRMIIPLTFKIPY